MCFHPKKKERINISENVLILALVILMEEWKTRERKNVQQRLLHSLHSWQSETFLHYWNMAYPEYDTVHLIKYV